MILHGWGDSGLGWSRTAQALSRSWKVLLPDLPGFGKSPPPPGAWGSEEYASAVAGLMEALGAEGAGVVAHSFGGRIGIRLAAGWPHLVSRLVLVASAGLRPRPRPGLVVRRLLSRVGRALGRLGGPGALAKSLIYGLVGSRDWKAAPPSMRPVLSRVVGEDLRPLLSCLAQPTLLVWGSDDREVPVEVGEAMARLIPRARLEVLPGAGHFPHLEREDAFLGLVLKFLEEGT